MCFYILINYLPDHQRSLFTLLPASYFTSVTLRLQHFHLPRTPPLSTIPPPPHILSPTPKSLKKKPFPLLSSLDYARSSRSLANEQGLGTAIIKLHVIWSNGMWEWKWGEETCWRLAPPSRRSLQPLRDEREVPTGGICFLYGRPRGKVYGRRGSLRNEVKWSMRAWGNGM